MGCDELSYSVQFESTEVTSTDSFAYVDKQLVIQTTDLDNVGTYSLILSAGNGYAMKEVHFALRIINKCVSATVNVLEVDNVTYIVN